MTSRQTSRDREGLLVATLASAPCNPAGINKRAVLARQTVDTIRSGIELGLARLVVSLNRSLNTAVGGLAFYPFGVGPFAATNERE
jgi:hypothetical protein